MSGDTSVQMWESTSNAEPPTSWGKELMPWHDRVKVMKFPLEFEHFQEVHMNKGAELLTINYQDEAFWVWARVDVNQPQVVRHVRMASEGSADAIGRYVGSAFGPGISAHLFDLGES